MLSCWGALLAVLRVLVYESLELAMFRAMSLLCLCSYVSRSAGPGESHTGQGHFLSVRMLIEYVCISKRIAPLSRSTSSGGNRSHCYRLYTAMARGAGTETRERDESQSESELSARLSHNNEQRRLVR